MSYSPEQIQAFLDSVFAYGPFWVYAVILMACFVENIFPPFPGDSFIVAAGALVGWQRLSWPLAMLVVVVGGLSSVMLLYRLGQRHGRNYFLKRDFKYFSADDIRRMESSFGRWGALILVVSRFVVGMRSALAIVAGISRYGALSTLLLSGISYLIFAGLIMYLSAQLVANLELVGDYFRTYNTIAWPLVGLVLIGLVIGKIVRMRKEKTT
ncbi:MAG: VTT domain-containing protein [bacterium]